MLKKGTGARLASLLLSVVLCVASLSASTLAIASEVPIAEDPFTSAAAVNLRDGTYLVDVTLEGGSGRASVTSPATMEVCSGKAVATIEWSSPNYDYMVVGGQTYLPINQEGNSTFQIPILSADGSYPVVGDTTAMSQPHEIDYQLSFDLTRARALDGRQSPSTVIPIVAFVAVLVAGLALAVFMVKKKGGRA